MSDSIFLAVCDLRGRRRVLCVFESVLLCAGDHAETEDDLRYLRSDDCDRGSDFTGICKGLFDFGSGSPLSASDASDDHRIFLL